MILEAEKKAIPWKRIIGTIKTSGIILIVLTVFDAANC